MRQSLRWVRRLVVLAVGLLTLASEARAIDIAEDFEAAVDPGAFTITGDAFQDLGTGRLVVTPLGAYRRGSFFWTQSVPDLTYFQASFDFWIGGGSAYLGGADGLTFAFVPGPTLLGSAGGDLGYTGMGGYAIEIDTYYNGEKGDPSENHIGVVQGSSANHLYTTSSIPEIEDAGWFHCEVYFAYGHVQVFLSNESIAYPRTQVVDFTIPDYTPCEARLGFTASSGAGWNDHLIDNVFISTTVGCPPAFADIVDDVFPGGGTSGADADVLRALDTPDGLGLALGNGGSVVLGLGDACVLDGPGSDLLVYEVGSIERANVFASTDGITYTLLGEANGTTAFDLAAVGLDCVRFVRIVDLSDGLTAAPAAGFDVDAVQAMYPACPNNQPVVVIPGIYGTYLFNDRDNDGVLAIDSEDPEADELIWLDDQICCNETDDYLNVLALLSDGSDPPLECDVNPLVDCLSIQARPIFNLDNHLCVDLRPIDYKDEWTTMNAYGPLIDELENQNFPVHPFPYDWRKGVTHTVVALHDRVTAIRAAHPTSAKVHMVTHSTGGLIARYYALLYPDDIGTLVFLGTPQVGAPQAYEALVAGQLGGVFEALLQADTAKALAENWPVAHDLLPSATYAALAGLADLVVLQTDDNTWEPVPLEEVYGIVPRTILTEGEVVPNAPLNQLGLDLHASISAASGVDRSIAFANFDFPTVTGYLVQDLPGSERVLIPLAGKGDGTVPVSSAGAALPGAHSTYYTESIKHADFGKDPDLATFIGELLTANGGTPPSPPPLVRPTIGDLAWNLGIVTLSRTTWKVKLTDEAVNLVTRAGVALGCPLQGILDSAIHIYEFNEAMFLSLLDTYRIYILECEGGFLNMAFRLRIGGTLVLDLGFFNIPFPPGTDGFIDVLPDGTTPTLHLDYDGDGIFEVVLLPSFLPSIISLPQVNIGDGGLFQYNANVFPTAGRGGIAFHLVEGPPGMTIDPGTGFVSWLAICGDHHVVIEAEEVGAGVTQQAFDLHVEDTTPPSILTPPDVDETTSNPAGEALDIGFPQVFDSCCAEIAVSNDAPEVFPVNETTPVIWTAEDCNHLVATAEQLVTLTLVNQPPVAVAGLYAPVECVGPGGTPALLDGTASSDPDGDALTYLWSAPGVGFDDPTSSTPTGTFPLGTTTVTLVVNDGTVDSDPDTADVTIHDTIPPQLDVSVSPDTLWPPNHKLVEITPTWDVDDICDPAPVVELVNITTDEGDETLTYDPTFDETIGEGNTTDDIQVMPDGRVFLRAERGATGDGRVYTLTYQATDASGNSTTATAIITVPHDMDI